MFSAKTSNILLPAALLISAFAGPSLSYGFEWDNKCQAAGTKAQAECQGHAAAFKAQEAARSSAPTSGDIQNNSARLASNASANSADATKAKGLCETSKKTCEQACDQAKSDAQPIAGNTQHPKNAQAKADVAKIDGTKASACVTPLLGQIAQLGAGATQAAQAAADANKTNGSTNGMPNIPMPPAGGGDKKDDSESKTETPAAQALNCENPGNSKYSDCNNHFIKKCQNKISESGCETFIGRYCGNAAPTPAEPSYPTAATANLVVGKQGEGMTSNFCKKVTAIKFCEGAGRSDCPSCKSMNSPWAPSPAQISAAKNTCPMDPVFLDPAVQAQLKDSAAAAGAANNANASTTTVNTGGSVSTQSVNFRTASTATSNSADQEKEKSNKAAAGLEAASDLGGKSARAVAAAGPQEVANQYGPSVFSIQSTTYRDLCTRGKLNCSR